MFASCTACEIVQVFFLSYASVADKEELNYVADKAYIGFQLSEQ